MTIVIDADAHTVQASGENMVTVYMDPKVTTLPSRAHLIAQILADQAIELFTRPTAELARQAAEISDRRGG